MKPEDETPGEAMPDDETIAAWMSGMLDAAGEQRMNELAARNEALLKRVERLVRLDDLVRAAVPAEPDVPPALLERLGLAPEPDAKVVDLAAVRSAKAARAAVPRSAGGLWRMAAQLALVCGIGMAVLVAVRPADRAADPAADYRALGSSPDAAASRVNALVKFAPGIGSAEAARIAGSAGLQLVGGPGAAGAWKAAADPARRAAALERLRKDARVIMAEPIDGAGQ